MTDREKLEKVIKGLECCKNGFCLFCPYNEHEIDAIKCKSGLNADALALLKAQEQEIEDLKQEIEGHKDNLRETLDEMMRYANELKTQEPHIMTLEEYEAWIDTPFTERNPVFHEERTKRGTVTCWVNTAVCTLREYGKNDRCWTSRPTDEQREAVKWG